MTYPNLLDDLGRPELFSKIINIINYLFVRFDPHDTYHSRK